MALNANLPVVNVGSRDRPVYLPVEVCDVEAGQPAKSKLSGDQTASMLRFAVMGRKPGQNAQSIVTKGVGVLGLGEPLNATLVRIPSLPRSCRDYLTVYSLLSVLTLPLS
jgi:hypothetical protein